MGNKSTEVIVGLFLLLGIAGLLYLAFQISGLTQLTDRNYYVLTAEFDNIGSLKPRAPVRLAGVKIGQVGSIQLDAQTLRAKVELLIEQNGAHLADDSAAAIMTQGLLGANFINIEPGFSDEILKSGDSIDNTRSAVMLENMLGQLMLSFTGHSAKTDNDATGAPSDGLGGESQNTSNAAPAAGDSAATADHAVTTKAPDNLQNVRNGLEIKETPTQSIQNSSLQNNQAGANAAAQTPVSKPNKAVVAGGKTA